MKNSLQAQDMQDGVLLMCGAGAAMCKKSRGMYRRKNIALAQEHHALPRLRLRPIRARINLQWILEELFSPS